LSDRRTSAPIAILCSPSEGQSRFFFANRGRGQIQRRHRVIPTAEFTSTVERWQARTCWSRDTSWPISDLSVHVVTFHARRVRLAGRIVIRFHNRLQNCLVCTVITSRHSSRQHHLPLKPTKHLIFSPSCDLWNPHISTRASKISHRGYIVLLLRSPPP